MNWVNSYVPILCGCISGQQLDQVTLKSWLYQLQTFLYSATCKTSRGTDGHDLDICGRVAVVLFTLLGASKYPLKRGQHRQVGAVTSADMDHWVGALAQLAGLWVEADTKCSDGGSVQVRARDVNIQLMFSSEQLMENSTQTVTDLSKRILWPCS